MHERDIALTHWEGIWIELVNARLRATAEQLGLEKGSAEYLTHFEYFENIEYFYRWDNGRLHFAPPENVVIDAEYRDWMTDERWLSRIAHFRAALWTYVTSRVAEGIQAFQDIHTTPTDVLLPRAYLGMLLQLVSEEATLIADVRPTRLFGLRASKTDGPYIVVQRRESTDVTDSVSGMRDVETKIKEYRIDFVCDPWRQLAVQHGLLPGQVALDMGTMPLVQGHQSTLAVLGAAQVKFGLHAQGHIETVQRMLSEGAPWSEIAAEVKWDEVTLKKHWDWHQELRNKVHDVVTCFVHDSVVYELVDNHRPEGE